MNGAILALSVVVFPGGFNLPMWAAERQGFFQANGVRVNLTLTPSSTFQMQGLAEGRFDIAMTAFDNVVAYQEGQGEAKIPENPDMFAFMGSDNGFLSVMGGKGIERFADVKGKKLSRFAGGVAVDNTWNAASKVPPLNVTVDAAVVPGDGVDVAKAWFKLAAPPMTNLVPSSANPIPTKLRHDALTGWNCASNCNSAVESVAPPHREDGWFPGTLDPRSGVSVPVF